MASIYQLVATRSMVDDLDRRTAPHICGGVYHYDRLAKMCKAGHNTVYRKVDGPIVPEVQRRETLRVVRALEVDADACPLFAVVETQYASSSTRIRHNPRA